MATIIPLLSVFPEKRTLVWRRELAACRNYTDALALAWRIIREAEAAERGAIKPEVADAHQLAFPWPRAE